MRRWRTPRHCRLSAALPGFTFRLINTFVSLPLTPRVLRYAVLRVCGVKLKAWQIGERCYFSGPDVSIGRSTFVNRGCVFDSSGRITIGERCALGMEVMFATSGHEIGDHERRAGALTAAPIRVGDGCWIGARAVILAGVTIADGCVIAAGAIVRADCEADTLYAGVPARAVKKLRAR